MKIRTLSLLGLLCALVLASCSNENTIPKEPTYLRPNFPPSTLVNYQGDCGYRFKISSLYTIKDVIDNTGNKTCHKDFDLGPLQATMHFTFIEMDKPLSAYLNFAMSKVDEHKVLASGIKTTEFYYDKNRVFGNLFLIEGNVATPIQFYFTDSTRHFASGIVYFNAKPNYDSLRPSIEYLSKDLQKMIGSFEWNSSN